MLDPFKVFARLLLAGLRVFGFTFVLAGQILWFLAYKRPDKIADAMGWYGREIIDSFSAIFRR